MNKIRDARHGAEAVPGDDGEAAVQLGPLADYVAFHLRMAQGASFRAFKQHTGEKNLRQGWFAVLALIDRNAGITPVALSRASGRDKSTLTPVLRDLTRERLIRREPMPNDRRSYSLHLTAAGKEKLAHLAACAAAHDRQIDAIVGEEKPALIRLLAKIVAELD
jgi:DNA-binding MarR family transcriptional regulator